MSNAIRELMFDNVKSCALGDTSMSKPPARPSTDGSHEPHDVALIEDGGRGPFHMATRDDSGKHVLLEQFEDFPCVERVVSHIISCIALAEFCNFSAVNPTTLLDEAPMSLSWQHAT